MESFSRVDLMQHTEFNDILKNLKPELKREELETIITATEFVYYGKRKEHLHEIFLPGQMQGKTPFFKLDELDEKYDQYRKLAEDPKISEQEGFKVDYGILWLLNKSKASIKQMKTQDPQTLEKNLYELGLVTIELALDTERFDQEKLKKVLHYYGDLLNHSDYLAEIHKKTETIIKQWQGTTEDQYTDQPKNIIPDEPDDVIGYLPEIPTVKVSEKKPVVPITNQSDLLKALGVNPLESIGELEKKVLPFEKKDAPVKEVKPKEYDECEREPVPGSNVILCKMPKRYNGCEYKGEAFKNPKWPPICNLDKMYVAKMLKAKK
jgi:hypothetical protein